MTSGETVKILGAENRDQWGKLLGYTVTREIHGCVVARAGEVVVRGEGYVGGDLTKFEVLAPAGTVVEGGQRVEIRGEVCVVDFPGFDHSVGRRPVLSRHRPRVSFTASRGEVHDHL